MPSDKKLNRNFEKARAILEKRNQQWFHFTPSQDDPWNQPGKLEILCHSRRLILLDVTDHVSTAYGRFHGHMTLLKCSPENNKGDDTVFIIKGTVDQILDAVEKRRHPVHGKPLEATEFDKSNFRSILFECPQIREFLHPEVETLQIKPAL